MAFDLLALGDEDLTGLSTAERRARLVEALAGCGPLTHVTTATHDADLATEWFTTFEGAGSTVSSPNRWTRPTGRPNGS